MTQIDDLVTEIEAALYDQEPRMEPGVAAAIRSKVALLSTLAQPPGPPVPNYVHRARLAMRIETPNGVDPVHDGDTYWLVIDLGQYSGGVRVPLVVDVRLAGIDTWELNDTQGRGIAAREAARNFLVGALTVATEKPIVPKAGGTLGRTVGRVWCGASDRDLADLLRAGGHAKDVEHLG